MLVNYIPMRDASPDTGIEVEQAAHLCLGMPWYKPAGMLLGF